MQIVRIRLRNFMSIAEADIRPGQVTQIVGKNSMGKTTIPLSLRFLAEGSTDANLVRFGEDEAEVMIELKDGTTVTRKVDTEGKQTVDVRRDGMKTTAPQGFLNQLFDPTAFNPLSVMVSKTSRKDAIMKSIDLTVTPDLLAEEMGVTLDELPKMNFSRHGLTVLDDCREYFYLRRGEANKDAKEKKSRYETYKADMTENVPTPAMSRDDLDRAMSSLVATRQKIEVEIATVNERVSAINTARLKVARYDDAVKNIKADMELLRQNYEANLKLLEERLANGQRVLAETRAEIPDMPQDALTLQNTLRTVQDEIQSLKAIETEIKAAESTRKHRELVETIGDDWKNSVKVCEELDRRVAALSGPIKSSLMARAELPVQGLKYVDGEFFIDETHVDKLSASKAMTLAVSIARKLSKKSKLICIDGAEMLDPETWAAFRKEIDGDGYTYFVTKVGDAFVSNGADTLVMMNGGQATVMPAVRQ